METKEIPREQWTRFFDGFSRRHEGWLVTVEVLGEEGPQVEVRDLPLTGIAADENRQHTISILVGGTTGEDEGHIIQFPAAVRVEEDGGVERALEIEARDGDKTIVTFRSALPPEMVDGVASAPSGGPPRKEKS
jgi:hypothetical protein